MANKINPPAIKAQTKVAKEDTPMTNVLTKEPILSTKGLSDVRGLAVKLWTIE
ncbi:hypothetical protein AsFPU1_2182 [Aphanothece sacrum FPU1]|uniref:Uncharacterized protein n=1 Tax=Aphanothece sacrum FPU1 TaxID=1920663 RepID=A0A401IHK5_APHSA|nr:hypothetical protein AsFPU1_2182 [Aphanothece sacrum FPU1]